jgi:BMFP domain-containing protein YqiC
MDLVEREIIELREEVITLRADLEKLKAKVTSLVVAQNQPLIPPHLNPQALQHEISSVITWRLANSKGSH